MAAVAATADIMTIQKNSQILVNVEEALTDLIIVSYSADDKKFQGVLLDSSKSHLPFGVYSLHPAFSKPAVTNENNDDKLHSVSQRFTYQEPNFAIEGSKGKYGTKGKGQQRQKMTVRLRPRKVLCSNCQGICNDNSENVDVSKKRKQDFDVEPDNDSRFVKKYLKGSMLIPKLSRLHPNEITSAIKGGKSYDSTGEKSVANVKGEKCFDSDQACKNMAFVSVSNDDDCDKKSPKDGSFSSLFQSARTLKICFGEGEGTVVKIPPLTGDSNEDSGVSCDLSKPDAEIKAAKKALKRAKKQAKKNTLETLSKWTEKSPKHKGALSPRNNVDNGFTDPLEKKHKHKVKHKKRSKVQKKRDENTGKCAETDLEFINNIKNHCLNQKLSISLRRLSSNSYERKSDGDSGSDDVEEDVVPNFPSNSIESIGGNLLRVSPGDIVWGKVVGFPWWPGRVLSVTSGSRAHVAWYASTTSSLMPCDSLSPFLDDYKLRFNKRKRGLYKEAVKLAAIEAKQNESHIQDPLASPTQNITLSPHPIDVIS